MQWTIQRKNSSGHWVSHMSVWPRTAVQDVKMLNKKMALGTRWRVIDQTGRIMYE